MKLSQEMKNMIKKKLNEKSIKIANERKKELLKNKSFLKLKNEYDNLSCEREKITKKISNIRNKIENKFIIKGVYINYCRSPIQLSTSYCLDINEKYDEIVVQLELENNSEDFVNKLNDLLNNLN